MSRVQCLLLAHQGTAAIGVLVVALLLIKPVAPRDARLCNYVPDVEEPAGRATSPWMLKIYDKDCLTPTSWTSGITASIKN